MEIKQLDNNKEFDVFVGKGWDNWIRVKYTSSKCEIIKSSFQPSQQTLDLVFFKIKKKYFTQQKKNVKKEQDVNLYKAQKDYENEPYNK